MIGFDLYRDFPVSSALPELATRLQQQENLIATCKGRDATSNPEGIAPPPEVPAANIGFSDFIPDPDGILRRQTLFMTPDPASPCDAAYSLSTRLATEYLEAENITAAFTPSGNLQLGSVVFPELRSRAGGYQAIDARGSQLLTNYRALPTPQDIAYRVSLTHLLTGEVDPTAIEDRLVFIGVVASVSNDYWKHPSRQNADDKTAGVFVQAHMTSQILSAVLEGRSLIHPWTFWQEWLWIVGWGVAGTCTACRKTGWGIVGWTVAGSGLLIASSLGLLLGGQWVPVLPGVLSFLGSGSAFWLQRVSSRSTPMQRFDKTKQLR